MKPLAPYQIFFPIGVLSSLLAVGVWLVQHLGWFSTPALFIHSKLIVGGFVWSFIVGFLMTAVPKMTGTAAARKAEVGVALLLMILMIVFSWFLDARYFYGTHIALILFLLVFGGRRVLKATKPAPVFFSHVGYAVILALLGAGYHYSGNSYMGIHLYHVGTILLLVLGIGTRFFSFLSGLPSIFETSHQKSTRRIFDLMGLGTGILLFLAGMDYTTAYLGLGIMTLGYLFFIWKVQRPSARPSALKWGVRIVALTIPLSFILSWIQPGLYLTWFHILFIGCFTMICYAVATRVTLAHGSYSLDIETKSRALWAFMILLVLSLVARGFYGAVEGAIKMPLLHAAVCLWVLAISCWVYSFFIRIFKSGKAAASC